VSPSPAGGLQPGFPLIAIGASTGGPSALARVISGLPSALHAGIVVVQHVDEFFAAGLAEWLAKETSHTVRIIKPGDRPEPGVVQVASTNGHLVLTPDLTFAYTDDPVDYCYRPSIDVFFHSCGAAVGRPLRSACCSPEWEPTEPRACSALRHAGWHTIAQDQASERRLRHAQGRGQDQCRRRDSSAQQESLPRSPSALQGPLVLAEKPAKGEAHDRFYSGSTAVQRNCRGRVARRVRVLLVDDQPMIGEAVRRMLAARKPILNFKYCSDPTKAMEVAAEFASHGDPAGLGHAGRRRPHHVALLSRQSGHPRSSHHRPLHQRGARGESRSLLARRQRLPRQAPRSDRAQRRAFGITRAATSR
jgi:hypothetical protein